MSNVRSDKPFTLAGRTFQSRLLVGTGKYRDMEETRLAIEASGAEIVTVAVRRTNLGQNPGEPNLLDVLPPDRYTILPNTAGCYDAVEAVRTCRLARELLDGHNLVKLEVLADQKTLFPNVIETLKAAEVLVKEGFDVMVYTSDDPIIARQLAEIGCIAVMPLAGLIGTGLGICNPYNLQIILEEAKIPVLVDAGVGTASDAAIALELGCDGVLMNTAIAQLMTLVNALYDNGGATKAELETVVQLLNPFAPHMTEELWEKLGHSHDEQLAYYPWPKYEEAKCVESTVEIAVQVNGKVKARLKVAADIDAAAAIAAAKADPAVAAALEGKQVVKEIYVKGRLVNLAVKG